ncbi:hypothetical protein JYU02_01195 [bacterium AH-315-P15]|nr:hypothetical protein [bacterium AH-315-P15]
MRVRAISTSRLINIVVAASLAGFCALVIWFAAPVYSNSLIAQRSMDTVAALERGEEVSETRLRATLAAIGPIDPERPAIGERLVNQSILTLALAQRLPPYGPEYIDALIQARSLAEARLGRAPLDTHTWVRFAYAEYLLNGPSEATFEALRMSHVAGPYEVHAFWPRLRLGSILWTVLDEDLKEKTILQGVALWQIPRERWRLARYFFEMPEGAQLGLRTAMETASNPQEFEDMIALEVGRQGSD